MNETSKWISHVRAVSVEAWGMTDPLCEEEEIVGPDLAQERVHLVQRTRRQRRHRTRRRRPTLRVVYTHGTAECVPTSCLAGWGAW
jgi:hypothetical protein